MQLVDYSGAFDMLLQRNRKRTTFLKDKLPFLSNMSQILSPLKCIFMSVLCHSIVRILSQFNHVMPLLSRDMLFPHSTIHITKQLKYAVAQLARKTLSVRSLLNLTLDTDQLNS